jgi:hypothetical protein
MLYNLNLHCYTNHLKYILRFILIAINIKITAGKITTQLIRKFMTVSEVKSVDIEKKEPVSPINQEQDTKTQVAAQPVFTANSEKKDEATEKKEIVADVIKADAPKEEPKVEAPSEKKETAPVEAPKEVEAPKAAAPAKAAEAPKVEDAVKAVETKVVAKVEEVKKAVAPAVNAVAQKAQAVAAKANPAPQPAQAPAHRHHHRHRHGHHHHHHHHRHHHHRAHA